MIIVVYDTAAENGGALTVLDSFYQDALLHFQNDIEWHFFVSSNKFQSSGNITVHFFKKTNLFRRFLIDRKRIAKIIENLNPDLVISLQNMPITPCKTKQFVFLHQSLQFCPVKFSLIKKSERNLALKQRITCNIYKKFLPAASCIFVQTNWMRQATSKWLKCDESKIKVVPTKIIQPPSYIEYCGHKKRTFFYPARPQKYKNHQIVLKAVSILVSKGISDFSVEFTTSNGENSYANELIKKSAGLPINFIGPVPFEKIWDKYANSILLFPSYLETCGLPLLEAKYAKSIVIASDLPFSHEALNEYDNALFFSHNNPEALAMQMEKVLNGNFKYKNVIAENSKSVSLVEQMLFTFLHNLD